MTEGNGDSSRPDTDEPLGESTASIFFKRLLKERPKPAPGLEPGKIVGDFKLVELIGQGGMGQVWEAEQLSLGGRRVAVKFVRPERVTPRQLEYFQREARAGGRLHHPGIVTVHGYGQDADLAWIAMEYVEGTWTLRDSIDEIAKLDEVPTGYDREVARLIAEIADAIQAAHDAGVIHRDLKPQNVLITSDNTPKITDFGLAKITDESALSETGEFAGTYFYMSPEQVAAKRMGIDHRTDIFSLGVILYEMLALRRPFHGDTSHQVAAQIVTKEPPDPRTIRSRVPRDLSVIAAKALEKDKDRRYQTMASLAADLRRSLGNEPILAKPPTRWERTVKWAKRNPTKSVASAITGVATLVLVLVTLAYVGKSVEAAREGTLVKRLSALQRLEDLVTEADDPRRMWPAYPSHITAYEGWINRAQVLVDDLPSHRQQRDELRARARPRTEEERREEREAHPEYPRLVELEREIAQRRRALARRQGDALDDQAEESVPVSETDAESLIERAEAHCAEGRDDEALDLAFAALGAASDEEKEAFEARYQELEQRVAEARSADGLAAAKEVIAGLQAEYEALDEAADERRNWRFPEEPEDTRWWHNQLTKLIEELDALANDETGLLGKKAISPQHGWSIPRRLAFAQELDAAYAPGGEYEVRWKAALPAIGETYPGLDLSIQVGLVPIWPDPESRLWEFWHVQSGDEPGRGEDGRLQLTEGTGLVLVLLRGGEFYMGAQSADPNARNHDLAAAPNEAPVHRVELSPFFLSKYEMTQGQWRRLTGGNPSRWSPKFGIPGVTLRNPVESVSWDACLLVLDRAGLDLPSEAQWEYGCRAGTATPWSWPVEDDPARYANLADQEYGRFFTTTVKLESWDDRFASHAPPGSLAPNAFGLHEVQGNLWEWCMDGFDPDFYRSSPERDPIAPHGNASRRVYRGGSFNLPAIYARSGYRGSNAPRYAERSVGVRPARAIAP